MTLRSQLNITPAIPTGEVIAHGAFSSIIELKFPNSRERIVGKVSKIDPSEAHQYMPRVNIIIERVKTISSLHHENIVENKGICFLPDRIMPVLLMERMKNSLQFYFRNITRLNLMGKMKILLDTACGINYLHNLLPPFVHGCLTAENILLDTKMRAKIGGFDIGCNPLAAQNVEYRAPEYQGRGTPSDPSMDIFSFGHLALVTLLQEEIGPLPPSQYVNEAGEASIHHEVDRRAFAMKKAEEIMSNNQRLFEVIKQCFSNVPNERPSNALLLKALEEAG